MPLEVAEDEASENLTMEGSGTRPVLSGAIFGNGLTLVNPNEPFRMGGLGWARSSVFNRGTIALGNGQPAMAQQPVSRVMARPMANVAPPARALAQGVGQVKRIGMIQASTLLEATSRVITAFESGSSEARDVPCVKALVQAWPANPNQPIRSAHARLRDFVDSAGPGDILELTSAEYMASESALECAARLENKVTASYAAAAAMGAGVALLWMLL